MCSKNPSVEVFFESAFFEVAGLIDFIGSDFATIGGKQSSSLFPFAIAPLGLAIAVTRREYQTAKQQ
jgi:hypothetical protein